MCSGLFKNELKGVFRSKRKTMIKKIKDRTFEVGDKVWRWYPPRGNLKLGRGWVGPYRVEALVGESVVEIARDRKRLTVHKNDLKPYEGNQVVFVAIPQDSSSSSSESDVPMDTVEDSESKSSAGDHATTRGGRVIRRPERFRD